MKHPEIVAKEARFGFDAFHRESHRRQIDFRFESARKITGEFPESNQRGANQSMTGQIFGIRFIGQSGRFEVAQVLGRKKPLNHMLPEDLDRCRLGLEFFGVKFKDISAAMPPKMRFAFCVLTQSGFLIWPSHFTLKRNFV